MRYDWQFDLEIDRSGPLPPFLQIARALTDDIRRGRLRPGDRLPGTRDLAAALRVHRNTIVAAFAELVAQGWLEAFQGAGTFVVRTLPEPPASAAHSNERARRDTPRRAGFTLASGPDAYRPPVLPRGTLNLSSGAPDARLVPAAAIGRAVRRVLARRSAALLTYGDPEGHPALRTALAAMLSATRALPVGADEVVVTRGSQMALSLVARALAGPGDVVAVESLGYRPAWEAFRAAGARVVAVPIDGDGIDVGALAALRRKTRVRAVYVTPHHQYPTTVTLTAARRLELLALARRERIAIVEDDYDHEFHFDGRPVLPLASADPARVVVYIGTLSKVLAPGIRLGYVAAPPDVVERLAAIRSLLDIQGDHAMEAAIAALIEDGEVQRHVARARRIYADRRDILAAAIARTLGDRAQFTIASGGMALWVRFTAPVDVERWARRSAERGVWWHTGKRYAFDRRPSPFARFSFAWLNERELHEAVRRLAAARPHG
ncbi:MAG TPA: PLP-dependent aminotransferase family protein [Vicinamibacterales bacterium]|nr:PLP-dependent aminotransferase family protein [Vicinamibacterales bacterium]